MLGLPGSFSICSDGQVGIIYLWHDDNAPFCGGTLVGPMTVISAAHCFYLEEDLVDIFKVSVGDHKISTVSPWEKSDHFNICSYFMTLTEVLL